MANLLRRLTGHADEQRYSIDQWLTEYLIPSGFANQFGFNGVAYPINQTMQPNAIREIAASLPGFTAALGGCPPAFAAQMVRALVLSQARFTFRNRPGTVNARKLFGTSALSILERPWPNGTTGELISRMEWHAGLAGNAYVTNYQPGRLRVLRPDWVGILYGSDLEPESPNHSLDGEIIAYLYQQGGLMAGNDTRLYTLFPAEVAHWSPLPDPTAAGLGMSWVSPALDEIRGDKAITQHKLMFFANGATPNMVVSGIPAATKEAFDKAVAMMEQKHAGIANAYRTLYLTAGADAKVVGSDLRQLDFKSVQGAGESRIASLSRVPASLLGISEGMQGSSLNAGNYSASRRTFADSWVYPTLQDLAGALSPLVNVPSTAELWFDTADMPFLREDAADAAAIELTKMQTVTGYVKEGYTPESAAAAVNAQDITLLKHTGLVSVQLQEPGAMPSVNGAAPKALPAST